MQTNIEIIKDQGKGRAFCFIQENRPEAGFALDQMQEMFVNSARNIVIKTPIITPDNWRSISSEIIAKLLELGVRQSSFVGYQATTSICQQIALEDQKLTRSLVLIDPVTRPNPSSLDRIIDRLEHFLPLGLPLRQKSKNFDSKPFLQRLRSPVLLFRSSQADRHTRQEINTMLRRIPTAWSYDLPSQSPEETAANIVNEFEKVPVKCPQKNR